MQPTPDHRHLPIHMAAPATTVPVSLVEPSTTSEPTRRDPRKPSGPPLATRSRAAKQPGTSTRVAPAGRVHATRASSRQHKRRRQAAQGVRKNRRARRQWVPVIEPLDDLHFVRADDAVEGANPAPLPQLQQVRRDSRDTVTSQDGACALYFPWCAQQAGAEGVWSRLLNVGALGRATMCLNNIALHHVNQQLLAAVVDRPELHGPMSVFFCQVLGAKQRQRCVQLGRNLHSAGQHGLHKDTAGYWVLELGARDDAGIASWRENHAGVHGGQLVFDRLHRLVCWMAHGPPASPDLVVHHKCGNQSCVSAAHLDWVSRSVNAKAAVERRKRKKSF